MSGKGWCPQCQELGYIEFKFDCEATPDNIAGYIPKRLPAPTAFEKKVSQKSPYEAMVYTLASWLGSRPRRMKSSEPSMKASMTP
jgi:hypothetical protein